MLPTPLPDSLVAVVVDGGALRFAAPVWLGVALGIVPVAAGLFVWTERRAGRRLARLIAARLRAQLAGADSPGRRRARFALGTLALLALALALARPQMGYEEQTVKRRGLDLLVAVDVSKSMLATDLAPSRLGRARLAVQDLLGLLPGDRVGLIAFAGTAFLQAPLTIDYEAVRSAVAELDTDLIPRGGTDIAAAIALALDAFGKAEGGHRAILLFTDGEELEEDAVKAAGQAAAAGVKIFTVGLGTAEGALVPQPRTPFGNGGDFVRDRSGALVRSKLDENRLRQIAAAAGGSYVHLTNSSGGDSPMKTLVERGLASLGTGEIDARTNRRPTERYQWPLGAALLCLGAGSLLGERRRASRPAARPVAAAAALRAAAVFLPLLVALPGATSAATAAAKASPPADPLELYAEGKYPDAYSAYEGLLQKHPDSAQLQFNAGASAFMAGQYDGALESFSRALAAKDADAALQAKTFYNLGNTLAQRGLSQKEASDARINDLKNAIQYYNSVLQAPPVKPGAAAPGQTPLRQDATHNRDLVQKRLDEELKKRQQQKQQQQQKKSGGKNDPNQKKPDAKSQPSPKPDDPQDPSPSDGDQDRSENSGQSSGSPKDGQPQNKPGSANPPSRPDPSGQSQDRRGEKDSTEPGDQGNSPDEANDPPSESDNSESGKPGQRDGKSASDQNSGQDPASEGEKNGQPRPQGELTARDAGQPSSEGEANENSAENAAAAGRPGGGNGRMSAAQARALLGALRNEDDKVLLNNPNGKKPRREAVYNDW